MDQSGHCAHQHLIFDCQQCFRSLGAIIDVAGACIRFQELGRSVPIHLTDRKLFRLDVLDLLQNEEQPCADSVMLLERVNPGTQVSQEDNQSAAPDDHGNKDMNCERFGKEPLPTLAATTCTESQQTRLNTPKSERARCPSIAVMSRAVSEKQFDNLADRLRRLSVSQ